MMHNKWHWVGGQGARKWRLVLNVQREHSPTTERDVATICICPFALSNFIHTFYTSNEFSLTSSTYKISISKALTVYSALKNLFLHLFFTNLSRLRMVSMALRSSPGGCPALEVVDTRPLPVTAVGEGRPKSIFQHKHGTVGTNLSSLRQSSAKV